MRRRSFLTRTLGGLATAWLAPSLGLASDSKRLPFTDLRRGVGIYEERGGAIAWLWHEGAFVAVDTQFPDTAANCWAGLEAKAGTGRKLDFLFNTHHHGDHTGGNAVFKPHSLHVVAHKNVPTLQYEAAKQRNTLDSQAYANMTFADTFRVDLGSESIQAKYYGAAHTNGDSVIHFEKANVAHLGDLVFNRFPAFIDVNGGASIVGWGQVLERIYTDLNDETICVFGHGNPKFGGVVGKRADLLVMRDFLAGIYAYLTKGKQAGKTIDELAKIPFIPEFPDHVNPQWGAQGYENMLRNAWRTIYP